jgi:hypothetical protein
MRNELKRRATMAVTLNQRAYEHAKELVSKGRFVFDERDAWSEHRPSAEEENDFIRRHGFAEYGKWYLGVDDERPENTKGHYEFPYGDFRKVGSVSGRVSGGEIQARIDGAGFSARLTLNTRGDRQSVTIASPGHDITEVSVALARTR